MSKVFSVKADRKLDSESSMSFTTHDGSESGQEGYPGTLIIASERSSVTNRQTVTLVRISADDATRAAVQWLKDLGREDLLAAPAYVPLGQRVGQFVRGSVDGINAGKVARILRASGGVDPGKDYAKVEVESGATMEIYNDPVKGKIWWEPVEVKVTPAAGEVWEVVE